MTADLQAGRRLLLAGDRPVLLTRANGAPAIGMYMRGPDGVHRAFQLQHLTVTPDGVSSVTVWFDTALFARFGLPDHLGADGEVAALAPGEAPHCGV